MRGPASWLPKWIQFLRPNATGRMAFSAALVLNSRMPITCGHAEILFSSLCINGEEFINGCYQRYRGTIVGMSFHRLEEVSPSVCPTAGRSSICRSVSLVGLRRAQSSRRGSGMAERFSQGEWCSSAERRGTPVHRRLVRRSISSVARLSSLELRSRSRVRHLPCRSYSQSAKSFLRGRSLSASYPVRLFNGGIAQLVERLVRNEKARGSNPLTSRPRNTSGWISMRCHWRGELLAG